MAEHRFRKAGVVSSNLTFGFVLAREGFVEVIVYDQASGTAIHLRVDLCRGTRWLQVCAAQLSRGWLG